MPSSALLMPMVMNFSRESGISDDGEEAGEELGEEEMEETGVGASAEVPVASPVNVPKMREDMAMVRRTRVLISSIVSCFILFFLVDV